MRSYSLMPCSRARPKLGSAFSVPIQIAFVDEAQPGQGQHLVHCVDMLGSTGDQLRKTACGDGPGSGPKFGDHAFEDAVDQTNVAVVKTNLNVIDGPCSNNLRGLFDIDAGKTSRSGEQRIGGDAKTGSDCAAEKLPFL